MTTEELVRYILSFLGGGVVAGTLNWIHATRSARRQREIDFLRDQLRGLYGPLFFCTNQSERLFDLCDDIGKAYNVTFSRISSSDPITDTALNRQAQATIDLRNQYVARIVQNNKNAMQLLEQNWHLIDQDDVAAFAEFQVDHIRFVTEFEAGSAKDVPLSIIIDLGKVSFMRPEMIQRVKQVFEKKRRLLVKLGAVRSW